MTETTPPGFGTSDLDAAFIADYSSVFHSLVFAAITFPILGGAEDLGAEEAISLGFEGPVIDGLRLFNLS